MNTKTPLSMKTPLSTKAPLGKKTTRIDRSFAGFVLIATAVALSLTLSVVGSEEGEVMEQQELMAEGGVSYNLYCQSCHGSLGRGDGAVADLLKIAPSDLTMISASRGGEFPAEEIYKIIEGREQKRAHGSDMPLWGDAFKRTEETDDEAVIERKIDALVVYLKAIQERLPEVEPATE